MAVCPYGHIDTSIFQKSQKRQKNRFFYSDFHCLINFIDDTRHSGDVEELFFNCDLTIGKKQLSKSWIPCSKKSRGMIRIGCFDLKSLFFRTSVLVHIFYLDKGRTIIHQASIKDYIAHLLGFQMNDTGYQNENW